jgi:hypothetical protein
VDIVLLSDLGDHLVLSKSGTIGTSEGRVGTWEDVVLLEPRDELGLRALD